MNEHTTSIHHDVYRKKYSSYRGRHDQAAIRDNHEEKYRNPWKGDHHDPQDRDDKHRH